MLGLKPITLVATALLFTSTALAQSPNPDPRVEELLLKLQQLTTPVPAEGSSAKRVTKQTQIKVIFNLEEKQSTVCSRNAQIFWSIVNLSSQFFSGTSTKAMNCTQGKCKATVVAFAKVPDTDTNQKIGVTANVLSNCTLKQSGNTFQANNAPAQTASLGGTQLNQGGVQEFKVNNVISDIRLKRDIAIVASLDNGLPLYRYRYLWSDTEYVGVMAQEVAAVMAEAVSQGSDGYLRVDYERLGAQLMTFDTWSKQRPLMARAQ